MPVSIDSWAFFSRHRATLEKAGIRALLPYYEYPEDLVNGIDLYEAVNLRGADKSFDRTPSRGKNHIFAADADNFFDLPGIINLYPGGGETIDVIRRETPFPLIARDDLRLTNRLSKLASKLKKRVHPYLPL
jgi:hypothetical protein